MMYFVHSQPPCAAAFAANQPSSSCRRAAACNNNKSNSTNSTTRKNSTPAAAGHVRKIFAPFVQIKDNDETFAIALDIPGYESSNVNVFVDQDNDEARSDQQHVILAVSGKRTNELYEVIFQKRFRLRESRLDMDRLDAELINGLLTISLPKKEVKIMPRRVVSIRTGPVERTTDDTNITQQTGAVTPAAQNDTADVSHDVNNKADNMDVRVEDCGDSVADDSEWEQA